MIKDQNKNQNKRRAERRNSLFPLFQKHHFVKRCCYATTFHSPERDFYFEKWPNSCSICAETSCLIQSDLTEARWVFSTESQAASQMHVRRARPCVMASKRPWLPTLQPGCKCESRRNNKQSTNISSTVYCDTSDNSWRILSKKQRRLKKNYCYDLQQLQPWTRRWSHTSLRSADAVPGPPRPCAENLILVLLHCWPRTQVSQY